MPRCAQGKDLAQKELEAARKKAGDLELKLKGAMQEKVAAVQEKVRARITSESRSSLHIFC